MTIRRSLLTTLPLAAVLAAGLVACREKPDLKFSHALHAEEAECSDCHGDEVGRTGMEPCKACHEIDEANPSEACLTCHVRSKDGGYGVAPAPRGRSYADVTFDHEPHADVDCARCHGDTARAEDLAGVRFPTMATCQGCHDGEDAPAGCDTCHERLRRDERPPSHDAAWDGRHGKLTDLDEATCAYCHPGRSPCDTCHRQTKPDNHTIGWKDRRHGLEARQDRDNCRACHQATFCSGCHQEPPRDHSPRAGWIADGHRVRGAASADSCRVCHRRTDPSCTACHPSGF